MRFNPDAYRENGLIVKHSVGERTDAIREAIDYVPQAALTITYLFYRSLDGLPEVVSHADYTLRDHVRRPGV